jgi:CheY-like chemotaxis protein
MKRSVLIVDDEFGIADVVGEVLAEKGYHVAIAVHGQQGMVKLAEQKPDLVLLDVMMPVLDGRDMLRKMRADPAYLAIPVIMMTALPQALPNELAPLYQAVLYKPFTIDDLFDTVERVLARRP